MTKMAAMPIFGKKPFKNLLLQNQCIDFKETWHEASMAQVLQCVYKSLPCDDLDLFLWQGQHRSPMQGKPFKMSFKVKVLQEMGSRTEY